MDTLVLQERLRTALAYRCPGLETSAQRFFYDKGANETTRSCDEYLQNVVVLLFLVFTRQVVYGATCLVVEVDVTVYLGINGSCTHDVSHVNTCC